MAVGEVLLSAFLQVLFDKLASRELLQFANQKGLRSKLKKWEKKLAMIQALLNDAEEKQLTDRAVKMWLDDLQDLAYDVEDILDECATEALGRKVMAANHAGTSKVQKLTPAFLASLTPSAVKFKVSMASKIRGITNRLEELCKLRSDLGLEKIVGKTSNSRWQRPSTTCVPTEPAVYGRDEDRKRIVGMVLRDEAGDVNFGVISIVGMGGMGKTTLARLVYNDEVMEGFNLKAWVCVSDDFDVFRISKAILESVISSPCDLENLNQVQVRLKEAVAGRKFLLVLDDVWSKNYGLWETLKAPFMVGAQGSKVIVTTRSADVALTAGPADYYTLKLLSGDDCWSLFVKHAFEGRDMDSYRNLELIRKKVVEKSRGLPLAAKTLGGLLRAKRREDEWKEILDSRIWDLPEENEIPPVLKLSYHHLPSHLKRCFAYCSILPKDYEFEEKELVLLWMAEGLLRESDDNKKMEDLGSEYFRELLLRSILQYSDRDNSKYVMHDLINDLAQWVSGETSLRIEDEADMKKQFKGFERARHSSYISYGRDRKSKFEVFNEVKQMRTFLPVPVCHGRRFVSNIVLSDLLPKLKKLRVICLRNYYISELPSSIGDLGHLRYLNFSSTNIRSLPESISSLFNLLVLALRDCSRLLKLPINMGNLINLRHLDITGANLIGEMPWGMKNMMCLQTLSNFIVGTCTGSDIKDLENLKYLCGQLCISRLENVKNLEDATILIDKKYLKVLLLEWGSQFDDSRNEEMEENVLDMLQPHRNITELTIKCFGGKQFPSWIGNPSLSNISVLRLENYKRCKSLPSLGMLDSLKDLTINGLSALKSIGLEFYGKGYFKPFQSLEVLCFEDLQELEHWEHIEENEHVQIFSRLCILSVTKCPKLSGTLPDQLPSLKKLAISECEQLVVSFPSLPVVCELEMDGYKGVAFSTPANSNCVTLPRSSEYETLLIDKFQKLLHLKIGSCKEFIDMWQREVCLKKHPQQLYGFTSLGQLYITNFSNLVSVPEACFLSNLNLLEIRNCNALACLPEGINHNNPHLKQLLIEGCHSLKYIVRGQLPSSLKRLKIKNCEKLQCLLDDGEDTDSHSLFPSSVVCGENSINICTSFLEYLNISQCPSLLYLSSRGRLPATLKNLIVHDCPKLESLAERFDTNRSLISIYIKNCENLQFMPEGLCNLSHLQRIDIFSCPSLVSFAEEGLPDTSLLVVIHFCEKLRALPNHLNSLKSLSLDVWHCPSIISFPREGLPTNLKRLSVVALRIYWPLIEWGLHKFTSLESLRISAPLDAISFPPEEMGMRLPTSLTSLTIDGSPSLKYLSSNYFQKLTSLEKLMIRDSPKMASFPKEGLPSSLTYLYIFNCTSLRKQCRRDRGREWPKIAHIPCIKIDNKFISDMEDEE